MITYSVIPALGKMKQEDYEFEARLNYPESAFNNPRWRFQHCNKIREPCQVWWHVPIIPTTREAKAGGSLDL